MLHNTKMHVSNFSPIHCWALSDRIKYSDGNHLLILLLTLSVVCVHNIDFVFANCHGALCKRPEGPFSTVQNLFLEINPFSRLPIAHTIRHMHIQFHVIIRSKSASVQAIKRTEPTKSQVETRLTVGASSSICVEVVWSPSDRAHAWMANVFVYSDLIFLWILPLRPSENFHEISCDGIVS